MSKKGDFVIRAIHPQDSVGFRDLILQLSRDEDFMMLEEDERTDSPSFYEAQIRAIYETSNSMILVCHREGEEKLLGFIGIFGGRYRRIRHTAHIVIGVLEEVRGMGIASSLMDAAFEWARNAGIRRLELEVVKDNHKAISLYRKKGFEVEGEKRESLFVKGRYKNEIIMAKILT